MRFATERLIAASVSKPNSLLNPSLTEGIMLFFIIIKNSKFKPEEYKMRYFILFLVVFCHISLAKKFSEPPFIQSKAAQNTIIRSKHWFGRLPLPKNNKNPLLIHDIFIISFDLEKKFPLWVAYHLSPMLVWGNLKEERKYVLDPLLSPAQSLSFKNYKGASNCDGKTSGYDKGHLAPLGSFKASPFAYQAQYLSNIVPQRRALNQGPWKQLEERVRSFVKKGNEVRILTGPLYGKEGKNKLPPCWKAAQGQLRELPHSYWKIIAFRHQSQIKVCSFLMPQKIKSRKRKDHLQKYRVKLEEIEQKMGLDLLRDTKQPVQTDCSFLFPQTKSRKRKDHHPKKYIVKLEKIEQRMGLDLLRDTKQPVQPDCQFLF